MVAELLALRASRSHGSNATAESYAARTGPAVAADGGNPTAASAGSSAASASADASAATGQAAATTGMQKQFQHQQFKGSITSKRYRETKTSGKTGRGRSRRPCQG